MKKPSYSLNNSSLFFGLNEVDFILLGAGFLSTFLISQKWSELKFFPVVFLLVSTVGLIIFRLHFRRHIIRDFVSRLLSPRIQRVSKN